MWRFKSGRGEILTLICLLGVGFTPLSADEGREIYKRTVRATAWVRTSASTGTGWVVDRSRKLLVTNHHVVLNEDKVNLVFPAYKNGKLLAGRSDYKDALGILGRVLDVDIERDLAVIQVEALPEETVDLKLAEESASPGDRVHSIGNPGASHGLWDYSAGTVRQVYRREFAHKLRTGFVQRKTYVLETQSATNHGDSGGPVVNDKGELVAVVSTVVEMDRGELVHAMNLNIDVREVRAFVDQTRRLLSPQTAADFALRGERHLERGRHDQAGDDLMAALKLDRNCAAAYRHRARIFLSKGDQETALADLNKAIGIDGNEPSAYFYRALTYSQKGKEHTGKAVADYTTAIQLDSKYARAYNNRGVLHELNGEIKVALADYTRAIDIDPAFATAYVNRGNLHRQSGEYKQAVADLEQGTRLHPTPHGVTMLALAHTQAGNPQEAVKWCDLSIKHLNPNYPITWRVRGVSLENLHQYEPAVASYSQAIKNGSNDSWVYLRRGTSYEELGDARADADYQKALELDPKLADQLKLHNRRLLKIVNKTSETLRVYFYYETLTVDDDWNWYPEGPGTGTPLSFDLEPGKSSFVMDKGYQVKGRRIRIWAQGKTTGELRTTHKDQDVWICRSPYRARKMMNFTYTFGK